MASARPSPGPSLPPTQPPTDVLRAIAECPSCGREWAIVFPDVRGSGDPQSAPLVCLECCPKPPTDS
jgi:hypothetical protein